MNDDLKRFFEPWELKILELIEKLNKEKNEDKIKYESSKKEN